MPAHQSGDPLEAFPHSTQLWNLCVLRAGSDPEQEQEPVFHLLFWWKRKRLTLKLSLIDLFYFLTANLNLSCLHLSAATPTRAAEDRLTPPAVNE